GSLDRGRERQDTQGSRREPANGLARRLARSAASPRFTLPEPRCTMGSRTPGVGMSTRSRRVTSSKASRASGGMAPRRDRPARPWITALLALGGIAAAGVYWARAHSGSAGAALVPPDSAPTRANAVAPPDPAPDGMVWIPGGEFSMGCFSASDALCGLP